MKILIVSDTHRRNENFFRTLDKVAPVDLVVHCGDVEGSERLIEEAAGCPVQMVRGNNDFISPMPREMDIITAAICTMKPLNRKPETGKRISLCAGTRTSRS